MRSLVQDDPGKCIIRAVQDVGMRGKRCVAGSIHPSVERHVAEDKMQLTEGPECEPETHKITCILCEILRPRSIMT
jgi:hypothetical protein